MKIKLLYLMMFVLVFIIAACGNELHSDLQNYKKDMKPIYKKENSILNDIDKLNLNRLDQLIGTEVTVEKRKELDELQNKLEKQIIPEVKDLKKQAENIDAKTNDVKDAHNIYVSNVAKKEKTITELNEYISLFKKSIESNEKILEYTSVFEQNKSDAEKNAKLAKNNAEEKEDYEALVSVIDKNSEELSSKAKYLNETQNVQDRADYIESEIIPLFSKNVKSLNQTNISSKRVNQMRQAQIEVYYTLINYYKERKKGIVIEDKLQKIQVSNGMNAQFTYLGKDEKYDKAIERLDK
ncbi:MULTISPECIES: EMYY motif lipoprotein [Mammaliicoccus]|uniref:EMYY motif lipoprotein n=2 Tax=Mammaliicoccus TaxID=2803850 RepID=A0ABS5MNI4_9STAP|nr:MULTISPECIES: EMYY motif lipoprotein [Mammaliicoccus]MBL0846946.1 EMYY motif lipoprotein [Mammaliicoccus fleurettii]MBO3063300.1 EMYY motif lipoprotein [Mammaliicoccus fleurettii]MBS3671670.1 EMYY motif lipoprotein [Mammaliicoccus fleurettii]MBS3696832.1 EMYY motif lipoprotein [Mammaliicoccus fleurettii]MEB6202548.1 EMYY motif lipoprotein [Mammaliicoccus fleurettii]